MFCSKCGAENSENYAFCAKCGAPLKQGVSNSNQQAQDQIKTPSAAQAASPSTNTPPSKPANNKAPLFSQSAPVQPAVADVAASTTDAPEKKQINIQKIAIIAGSVCAVVIIAIVCLNLFVFNVKPCYRIKSTSLYSPEKTTLDYTYFESGAVKQLSTTKDDITTTTEFKNLGDGLSISEDRTGTYETNSNGDVTRIEAKDSKGTLRLLTKYEYYSAGIVKSSTQELDGVTTTVTYDEDGFRTSLVVKDESGKTTTDNQYTHELSDDERTLLVYSTPKSGQKTLEYTAELDENGNITAVYKGRDKSSVIQTYTYEKIDHPEKMATALARLKGY